MKSFPRRLERLERLRLPRCLTCGGSLRCPVCAHEDTYDLDRVAVAELRVLRQLLDKAAGGADGGSQA